MALFLKRKLYLQDKHKKQYLNYIVICVHLLSFRLNTKLIFLINSFLQFLIITVEIGEFFKIKQSKEFISNFAKTFGCQKSTHSDFVYGELRRTNYISERYAIIIKYWFKILRATENKHIKEVYNMM